MSVSVDLHHNILERLTLNKMNNDIYQKLNLSDDEVLLLKETKQKVKVSKPLLGLLGFFLFLMIVSRGTQPALAISIILTIIDVVIIFALYIKAENKYNLLTKQLVVSKLFKQHFDNVVYEPEKGFEEDYIDSLELVDNGNEYESNDLLSGTYKGINFEQADVDIVQVTSNGKTTTRTTLFEGRWIIVDFIKNFNGYHQVRSNGSFFKNSKPRSLFFEKHKTNKVKFESNKFNEQFSCFSNNNQEAYYLITPNMMEKMSEFTDYVNCEVNFGFINNQLHVAIDNRVNAFEVNGKDINESFIRQIEYEMELIKKVIDELDLEVDIFK